MTSEFIIGYDPGGNDAHGVAVLKVQDSQCIALELKTLSTTEDVINLIHLIQRKESKGPLTALGVDTLTCWCTGPSGWRPADRWLREENYPPEVRASIVSPNGLYGSMGLNGMAVLLTARQKNPELFITETHPKVLYYCLSKQIYNYEDTMLSKLSHEV